ncbi:MAG TPA: hypothetical protein VGC09_18355 [Rhodopila sp.]
MNVVAAPLFSCGENAYAGSAGPVPAGRAGWGERHINECQNGIMGVIRVSQNVPLAPDVAGRWIQLWLGVLCMALIANLQYAWTLFVDPIHVARGWNLAEIQWAFSIFIAT